MEQPDDDDGREGSGGLQPDLIGSYLAFAKRALSMHWRLSLFVFVSGAILTASAYKYLPRTYNCRTVLLGQSNQVLEGRDATNPLSGAGSLIMRHENLEALIRETSLLKKFEERRPPLLKLKDGIQEALFGQLQEAWKLGALVGTLEMRMGTETDGNTLSISVDWSDPQTAAELAEAAREGFVRNRHAAEMSAFEEKLAILDGHASKLRQEIEGLAQQVSALHEEKVAQVKKAATPTVSPAPPVAAPVLTKAAPPSPEEFDAQPARVEKLASLKRRLADLEGERERRIREETNRLAELKLRLAPSHPDVVTAERRLAMLAQEPSEIALARAEVKSLDGEIKQRDALTRRGSTGGARGTGGGSPATDPLPADIVRLLEQTDVDPAVAAQLSGAVTKYGALRDEIRSGRIDLDTAQAAFNYRYKVIVPAEAPSKATKPKPAAVIGGGLVAAIVLALLLPILAELRKGIIVERWQVQQFQLPVLAELQLPPHASDGDPAQRPPS